MFPQYVSVDHIDVDSLERLHILLRWHGVPLPFYLHHVMWFLPNKAIGLEPRTYQKKSLLILENSPAGQIEMERELV